MEEKASVILIVQHKVAARQAATVVIEVAVVFAA
jgi:hypothetical protein